MHGVAQYQAVELNHLSGCPNIFKTAASRELRGGIKMIIFRWINKKKNVLKIGNNRPIHPYNGTVKRGKIGHLITFRSKLKIFISIFLDFCAGKVCMTYGTSVSKA
jgi:hypothetical protein